MVEHNRLLEDRYLFSVLEGFMVLILLGIIQKDSIDTSLLISVYAIAVAIPSLATAIMIDVRVLEREENDEYWLQDLNIKAFIGTLSLASSFTAVISVFWHFSAIAGIIFTFSTIVAFKTHDKYFKLPLPDSLQKTIDKE